MIKAAEISELLKSRIKGFEKEINIEEIEKAAIDFMASSVALSHRIIPLRYKNDLF